MDNVTQQVVEDKTNTSMIAYSTVQQLAHKMSMSFDEFAGEMRKLGCSEPTAAKIWRGEYETYKNFNDHDMSLSNLRKTASVLKVNIGSLFPEACTEITKPMDLMVTNQDYITMTPKEVDVE